MTRPTDLLELKRAHWAADKHSQCVTI